MAGSLRDPRHKAILNALRELRRERGLSQTELASTIGKPQQFVSKYESGERRLDAIELLDIAVALGVEVEDIFSRADV